VDRTSLDRPMIFGGTGSRRLSRAICTDLGVPLGAGDVIRFSEGNLFVRIKENVRGRSVFIVQSTAFPANDNFMELLFWLDAFKRASAASVTAVVPYFSYAKGDKKDEPRVSIRARVCADAMEAAGADRLVTLDLHAPQIQGFFKIPVDDLYALPILCDAIREKGLDDLVVVFLEHPRRPLGARRQGASRSQRVRRRSRDHR
jgi:ribose-phosphate pyrophosphokinase